MINVRTLCLGLLSRHEASGYEIRKLFEGPLRHLFFDASFGSIYPALAHLKADGLVQCTELAQARRPDKKIYRITAKGRLALLKTLSRTPEQDRFRSDFAAMLMFADLMAARHLAHMIDARIAAYSGIVTDLAKPPAAPVPPGERFVNGLTLAMYRAAIAYIEDNRHLVESAALAGPGVSAPG